VNLCHNSISHGLAGVVCQIKRLGLGQGLGFSSWNGCTGRKSIIVSLSSNMWGVAGVAFGGGWH